MRYYSIKNKITGQYITGLQWKTGKKRGEGSYSVSNSDVPIYSEIANINYIIESLIHQKFQSVLDDCEIEAYKKVYVTIKSSIKLKTVRNRIEQREIIKKLKGQ